jgi:hypothetical protein
MGATPTTRGHLMGLRDDIHRLAASDPDGDPTALAEGLIARYTRDDLIALLADEIAREQRAVVAAVEARADLRRLLAGREPSGLVTGQPSFVALLGHRFALGTGDTTTWGSATVEEHEVRIRYLEKLRDGLNATIERHRQAIALIRQAGVECLGDLAERAA